MIINKACFETRIGTLCYLWLEGKDGVKIAAMGLGRSRINDYLAELRHSQDVQDKIIVRERKYGLLEKKVSGYLEGVLRDIALEPVFLTGTGFQKRVWQEATGIPFGCTCSYGDLAAMCDRPGAGRAVGNAMGRNPVMLIVPCHRVIKSDGSPGGFGSSPRLKKELLAGEGVIF